MGDHEVSVLQVDPIRGQILVALPDGTEVSVAPEELTKSKPEPEKIRCPRKRRREEQAPTTADTQAAPPITNLQAPTSTDLPAPVSTDIQAPASMDMNFDFSIYVLKTGSVLKVGSLCFVDSCKTRPVTRKQCS